ncbi:MAG TPA: hypothetical protein VH682_06160 [Gemmataceae bacterium]
MKRTGIWAALVMWPFIASPVWAELRGEWVTSDRTVDCSSYESIARDVLKPGMTDEAKAIALFQFFRQRVYHYLNLPESREPLKTVNIMGNTLCGSQATCMKGLLQGCAGLKTRVVSHPGHTFYEVWYDDKWHGYDTMTNFYVFTRGDKRSVASFEELRQDPTLIRDAIKEGRATPNMCCCGDEAKNFAQKIQVTDYTPATSKWSVKDGRLRLGEEMVRSWWPEGKALPGSQLKSHPGPLHGCGTRDRGAEPFLYKFWEPYGIAKFGGTTVSYRHYFNGQLNYAPDLTDRAAVLDGGNQLDGAQVTPQGLAGPGTYTVSMRCPFYFTGALLHLDVTCPGAGDSLEVEVSQKSGAWKKVFSGGEAGRKEYRIDLDGAVAQASIGRYEYTLKIALKGKAVLHKLHARSWFQHNAMAAPHLMSGANVVKVEVANEEALQKAPLTLIYRYREAPKWQGDVKSVQHTVRKNGETFRVETAQSEKLPQMRDLTLRYGKLAWNPDK